MIGSKYGKWTVLAFSGRNKQRNALYLCECECGNKGTVNDTTLKRGGSTQCKICSSKINGRKGLDSMAKQHLYMIGCKGYLKIGSSDNIERRFKDLSNACPFPLEILYAGIDEGFMEPAWHAALAEHRIHGEWFNL